MSASFLPMTGIRGVRGYTLVELLTVLAVMALLVSVGVPLFGNFSRDADVGGAASGLAAALNDARSRAAAERATVQVRAIDGSWRNGWEIVRVNKPNDPTDDQVLFVDCRSGDVPAVEITEASSATAIEFDPEGRAAAARNFRIGIRGGGQETPVRLLAVNALGRVDTAQVSRP